MILFLKILREKKQERVLDLFIIHLFVSNKFQMKES